ncbi:MAG: histidinol-phosphate transaminase [Deltaproteobacteria bacterium]|jgi:histidinol-phosphate aminotransferase|nr:histidinol-phosphate transaminase [Deltaproteobacteria bacterium]
MTTSFSARLAVRELEPYAPGLSIDEIRSRYGLERIIKLASNENPLGVSPLAKEAVERKAASVFRYAQSGCPRLVEAIAGLHGLSPDCVVIGNGSDEVIDLLIRCLAEPGRNNVAVFKPCFGLYPLQSRICGVELRAAPLRENFHFDWEALLDLVDERTSLVFVTTPDNPSGYSPPAPELEKLALRLPAGTLLVLDEAYMDFAACSEGIPNSRLAEFSLLPRFRDFGNLAVLRTFSKLHGLAGLRLGYGLMPAELASCLCRARLPFSVNILAEAAGLAALEDRDFLLETLKTVERGRELLQRELAALGCRVYPSSSNFIMFAPPERDGPARPEGEAGHVFESLLRRGVIVRRLNSYGLPGLLRVSVGKEEENRIFLTALREILA